MTTMLSGGWEWELRTRADSVDQFLDAQQCQQKWPERDEESGTDLANNNMPSIEEDGALISLPPLRDAISDPIKQRKLLIQKLRQCQKMFDFGDPMKQKREKEVKTDALKELNEFIAIGRNSAILTNAEIGTELFKTVECNLFRMLPPSAYTSQWKESNAEDLLSSSPSSSVFLEEPAWPHLQPVYRLLRQLIGRFFSDQLEPFISDRFCFQSLELLRSADSREREQARQIVYDIYTKLTERRTEIRKQMANILLSHTFECMPFNGVDELLQILGDIINGFNVPLKDEHRQFLLRVLLPLHKSPALPMFFSKLAYCVMLFVEKDIELAKPVTESLLRTWPSKCGIREILFIAELDEILSLVDEEQFRAVMRPLFGKLIRCTNSQNARVAERALILWKSPKVLALLKCNFQFTFSVVIPTIDKAQRHWSSSVASMSAKTMETLRKALEEADKQQRRRQE